MGTAQDKEAPHAQILSPGARLLSPSVSAGAADGAAESDHHVPQLCRHVHGGPAGQRGDGRRHGGQRAHLHYADRGLRLPERPGDPGQPVLGARGRGQHQPLSGRGALCRHRLYVPCGPDHVPVSGPGAGPHHAQSGPDRPGPVLHPDCGLFLHFHRHQQPVRRRPPEHGVSIFRYGPLYHLHVYQHIPELYPDFR